jgi:mono/diheme cytochrome c family protein
MGRRWLSVTLFVASLAIAGTAWAQDSASIERGMKLFGEQKCSMCHSIAGKGNAKGVLDGIGSKLSAKEIHEWLVNPKEMTEKAGATRKPPMKSFASLPTNDLDALVAYILTLKKK